MRSNLFPLRLILLFVIMLLSLLAFSTAQLAAAAGEGVCSSAPNLADCQALVELYEDTGGADWTTNSNWLDGGSLCSPTEGWFGVICDGDQRVQQLLLVNNNLTGTLPASLLNLEKLTSLFLSENKLSGPIPEISNLASPLNALYLNKNGLEGEIPAGLGSLNDLQFLYLNGNLLRGAVPDALCGLDPILSGTGNISLDYNALDIDESASDLCLDSRGSTWRSTQTVPPAPQIKITSIARSSTTSGEVTLTWEPIEYVDDGGYYEAHARMPGEAYGDTPAARTSTKEANSVTVRGLDAGQDYFFVVNTKTLANENNPNIVSSEFSYEITNRAVALTLADFQAAGGESPLPLIGAAFLLLLIFTAGATMATRCFETPSHD